MDLEAKKDYELDHDADTLIRAEEIKNDKVKMEKLQPILKKKQAELKRKIKTLGDLRRIELEESEEEDSEEENEDS